jgi:hypothetical protein
VINQVNPAAHPNAYFSPFPVLPQRQIYNMFECQYTFSSSAIHSNATTTKTSAKCSSFHISSDMNMYSDCQTHFKDFELRRIKDFSVILNLKIHSTTYDMQVYDVYNIQ